jgi:hypothetical protein
LIIVANVKWGQPGIYIGRAVRCWSASPLANPFAIAPGCSRTQAIERYRVWLLERIAAGDPAIIKELNRIKDLSRAGDVRLNCWCRPQDCHGSVVRDILETME